MYHCLGVVVDAAGKSGWDPATIAFLIEARRAKNASHNPTQYLMNCCAGERDIACERKGGTG